jgi:hypothetical protein
MPKQRGSIDLVKLFQADAIELMSAVARGQVLHGTKNIRESGSPLEVSFRRFLRARLSVLRTFGPPQTLRFSKPFPPLG